MPPDTRRREHQESSTVPRRVPPCPSPSLLECDTNDLAKSRSEQMDVRLTMQCVRLSAFAQSNQGSVVRVRLATRVRAAKRKAQHVPVPRCQFPRWVATPAGASSHVCAPTGVSGHADWCQFPRWRADRCQWPRPPVSVPTSARRPVSVATLTGVSTHAALGAHGTALKKH